LQQPAIRYESVAVVNIVINYNSYS